MKHKIIWKGDAWGGSYPACPKCGEPAYEPDHCFNCGVEFEQEDSEESDTLKKDVLMILIRIAVDIMPGAEIIPSTYIAKLLKQPIRAVRKALKELESEGLVRHGHEGGWNEYSERPFCIWGYCITQKAMELPEYEEAKKQEEELIRKIWFGGDT